jgi:PleD family two-component response regulator
MMDFFTNNYQWIFSGIGVAIIGWLGYYFLSRNKTELKTSTQSNSNNITINNNAVSNTEPAKSEENGSKVCDKVNYRILFVDDKHTEFRMVSQLKKAGWINTKAVKDIVDLDDPKVKEASLIFVDINGVGTQLFEDQGLGLAAALKDKYQNKTVILYSSDPEGDRFNKKLKKVDDSLPKNADPYEFISLIEQYCNK